jgi:hypothetical protein
MERINGKGAYDALKNNPTSYWRERCLSMEAHSAAAARLGHDFPMLDIPTIPLRQSHARLPTLYAMGSCFARELEVGLAGSWRIMSEIAPYFHKTDEHGLAQCHWIDFANRYNSGSLLREVARLTGNQPLGDQDLIIDGIEGIDTHTDLHFIAAGTATRRQLSCRRRLTLQAGAGLFHADVVVLTIGLNEAWFDLDSNTYLNNAPSSKLASTGRFELHILGCSDVVDQLRKTISLVDCVNSTASIVLSVSPVPMLATFTGDDVICANARSKATLLSAVREVCSIAQPNVFYFPSFELVTCAEPRRAWGEDRRHPSELMIAHIVNAFLRATSRASSC